MSKINLYSIFHLNLAFSSIPENQLPIVIKKCYWPLLQLIKKFKGAIAIEATGYTIEKIQELDPKWIKEFSYLLENNYCEFIGSGYAQIIGPLVPAEVNDRNLKIGNQVYKNIINTIPKIVYVNEQAYSKGLIKNYLENGYKSLIMEWDNAYQWHPEWNRELQYAPQRIGDDNGNVIKVIWNNSIAFQKFQRYAHNEIDLSEYTKYLKSHLKNNQNRFFPLYGNDTEIFNFRPGRYKTESKNISQEWDRIEAIFETISKNKNLALITPEKLLAIKQTKILHLESSKYPIVVKKQEKYNIVRWALTGRDDLGSNTVCYKIFSKLKLIEEDTLLKLKKEKYEKQNNISLWKRLCFLWDSDFRTHTEIKKYLAFKKDLARIEGIVNKLVLSRGYKKAQKQMNQVFKPAISGRVINVTTSSLNLKLNKRRGLTIDELIFKKISPKPLFKILPHGYYEKISFGADFYTGHTIIEAPAVHKITDLNPATVRGLKNDEFFRVDGDINMNSGKLEKSVMAYHKEPRIDLRFNFILKNHGISSFRTGIITFNPEAFDQDSLFFRCHNGGENPETFYLKNVESIDIRPASLLISAQNILGNTTGCLEIGDGEKSIFLKNNLADLAALPMIHYIKMGSTYFLRVLYSLGEIDETSLLRDKADGLAKYQFNLSITAKKNEK